MISVFPFRFNFIVVGVLLKSFNVVGYNLFSSASMLNGHNEGLLPENVRFVLGYFHVV